MWICQICFISTWLFFSIVYCFLIINVIHLVSFLILIFDGKTVDWSSETCKVLVNKMPFLINIHQRKVTGMNIFSSNGFFFSFSFSKPKDGYFICNYLYLFDFLSNPKFARFRRAIRTAKALHQDLSGDLNLAPEFCIIHTWKTY